MTDKLRIEDMELDNIKDLDAIMSDFAQYKIMKEEAEKYLKEIKSIVEPYMESKGIKELVGTEHKFKLYGSHNTSFKKDLLLDVYPEAEKFMTISNFNVLKLA